MYFKYKQNIKTEVLEFVSDIPHLGQNCFHYVALFLEELQANGYTANRKTLIVGVSGQG